MNRSTGLLVVVLSLAVGGAAAAQTAPMSQKPTPPTAQKAGQGATPAGSADIEKTLEANERAINEAVVKGDKARFKALVAQDSWSIDPMGGRSAMADFMKQFDAMTKEMQITAWNLSDFKTYWVNPNVAVVTYKWTGEGTFQGQKIPSPVWASTVWARRNAKWQAVFHQESPGGPPAK